MNRFISWNDHIIQYDMLSKNNIENVMQMPRLSRIDLNTGVGKGVASIDRKQMIGALFTLEFITGQKPSITRAKKSIDKFKLREKMMIGCKVTLRKKKMFFFLDRLVRSTLTDQGSSFALQSKGWGPQHKLAEIPASIKKGVQEKSGKKARHHNLAFGIENVHGAFKELPYGHVDVPCGMNISICSQIQFLAVPRATRIQFSPNFDPGMTDGFQMPLSSPPQTTKENDNLSFLY